MTGDMHLGSEGYDKSPQLSEVKCRHEFASNAFSM